MKPKTIILMVVAVTCGLGASYMTTRLLAERQVADPEMVTVLVAKKDLNLGESIKVPQDWFEEKPFLPASVPLNALTKFDEAKDRSLNCSRKAGDIVTQDHLFGVNDSTGFIATHLPKGYRAVGIRVTMENIAAGFAALPMSKVDIVWTVRRADDKSTYAKVLLHDILVLAADTRDSRDERGKAMPASVVTVAVKADDAPKIMLASSMGSLSLMLRKVGDTTRGETDQVNASELQSGKRADEEPVATPVIAAEPPKKEAAPPPVQAPVAVQVDPNFKHVQVIYEGAEPARRTEFLLNKNREVVTPLEVNRSELTPPQAAPAPSPTAPPAPAATPKPNDD